jgi:hypothetical protein
VSGPTGEAACRAAALQGWQRLLDAIIGIGGRDERDRLEKLVAASGSAWPARQPATAPGGGPLHAPLPGKSLCGAPTARSRHGRWRASSACFHRWIGPEIKLASERRAEQAEHAAAQEAERRAVDVRGVLRQAHVLRGEAAAEVQRFFRYEGGALQVLKAPAAPLTT